MGPCPGELARAALRQQPNRSGQKAKPCQGRHAVFDSFNGIGPVAQGAAPAALCNMLQLTTKEAGWELGVATQTQTQIALSVDVAEKKLLH